jgi:hypothetical protein
MDAAGLGPVEAPYRILAEVSAVRVRAYHDASAIKGPTLLIVPPPISDPSSGISCPK